MSKTLAIVAALVAIGAAWPATADAITTGLDESSGSGSGSSGTAATDDTGSTGSSGDSGPASEGGVTTNCAIGVTTGACTDPTLPSTLTDATASASASGSAGTDSDGTGDSGSETGSGGDDENDKGCSCRTGPSGAAAVLPLVVLAGLVRRRAR